MKLLVTILMLVVVLCLVDANGRHVDGNEYDELSDGEEQSELLNRMKDHTTQMRHRRRSRQMFPYDYPPPFYYPERRDFNRHQEEYLTQIVKSLEEIIAYMRRPPPPPQPVYIPYPVVKYRPCICRGVCRRPSDKNQTVVPGFGDRIAGVDDDNRIWIGTPEEASFSDYDSGNDGARPITFNDKPSRMPNVPAADSRDEAPVQSPTEASVPPRPGPCETAILDCCGLSEKTERSNCFARYKCSHIYATNRACEPNVIKQILEMFKKAYAPVNNI